MKLFTQEQWAALLENGKRAALDPEYNPLPVVKLFTPDAGATWLLAWVDPELPEIAYGLCDLGLGFPELGPVCIGELRELRGHLGLPVERDLHWEATKTLNEYAADAWAAGGVR